ncbi:glycoside hydrolase family 1 protein [Medicago truncatula]|uniref:Glycoside hydrolase family 1 protein n=1 Tax=Medicago truncatula TaxID=3880 RepID=A0A072TX36_MEDTR|nr:glycoside hydrolase family 1 protein [Medicago truncatula]
MYEDDGDIACDGYHKYKVSDYRVHTHMLLAHASAATLYKKKYKVMQHGIIELNLLTFGFVPLTNTSKDISKDIIATQMAQDFMMGWVLNP